MSANVILHIGQQKSGTTYLQRVLGHCADGLADAGVLFPPSLREAVPDTIENHERATYGLLGTEFPWVSEERAAEERPKWDALAAKVQDWPGTALISAEALSVIRRDAIDRLLAALDGAAPSVVVTARPLGRSLPSLWQQHVRNGRVSSLGAFFAALARQRERGERAVEEERDLHLWRSFALGRLARRWAAAVGPERVTVVVNPGTPRDLLWERFRTAIGAPNVCVPDDVLALRTHESLTLPQAQVMVRLNEAFAAAGWDTYEARAVREAIVLRGTVPGPRPGVPEAAWPLVESWTEEDIADLCGTGAQIIGHIDELRFRPDRDLHATVTHEQIAQAAAAALLAVADRERFAPPAPEDPAPARARRTLRMRR
ncbi:hypothetical protein [Actinomadura atramentaria]|uniref:hypothetical protein n=1 Tax=Actinomadura atramentaria TaxID=1990 RepID=UPI00035EB52B|nr:hypothetical protein [Actinomadura atramentaria]